MGSLTSFRFSEKASLGAPGKLFERESISVVLDLVWDRTLNVNTFV